MPPERRPMEVQELYHPARKADTAPDTTGGFYLAHVPDPDRITTVTIARAKLVANGARYCVSLDDGTVLVEESRDPEFDAAREFAPDVCVSAAFNKSRLRKR